MSQNRYDNAMAFLASQLASMASLESKSDLVIGIDFGTTFTGVAFAHTGNAAPRNQEFGFAISTAYCTVVLEVLV